MLAATSNVVYTFKLEGMHLAQATFQTSMVLSIEQSAAS